MTPRQRRVFAALTVLWLAALAFFWTWWLRPANVVTPFGMVVNSAMFVWTLFLPGVFLMHLGRMARTDPTLELPTLRVAMIVTKAPAEPWEVVQRTLRAMLRQRMPYPYDVWLADEAPTAETRRWCEANGVRVSSRQGRADFHRAVWPRRTRCKEGNLAFFYEQRGYDEYDVVAQLDADHRPEPTYLCEMVRPFVDPEVGYVAAPSSCDANARVCWAARGRLYKEAVFHGPQQAGGHHALPPVCIGSHYAVRTRALREIGGIGPELAEDFSTSLIMNAFGWRGVFALDAEAHGDGPETFADFVTQEFQWARSLSDVMLHYNRRYWRGLDIAAKFKLGFGEIWYPLYALHMLAAALFPVVALLTGTPWASVRLVDFFAHSLAVGAVLLAIMAWVRAQGWLRPADAPLLSWEAVLFLFARWPWVLWGVVGSWAGWLLRRRFTFKVTPKGVDEATPLGLRAVCPYLLLAGVCAVTAVYCDAPGPAVGYYYFCLVNAVTYVVVAAAVIVLHLRESDALSWSGARRLAPLAALASLGVGALVVAALARRAQVAARVLLPDDVRRAFPGLPDDLLGEHLAPTLGGDAPEWLVLAGGLSLLLIAIGALHAPESHARERPLDITLRAITGLTGVAFIVLAGSWRLGSSVAATSFAVVVALGALSRTTLGGRRRLALPAAVRDATTLPAPSPRVLRRGARPRQAAAASGHDVHVAPPPAPASRRERRRTGRRTQPSAGAFTGPGTQTSEPPAPGGWLGQRAVEDHIELTTDEQRPAFVVRPLPPYAGATLDAQALVIEWNGTSPPPRTDAASRAHAILFDRLVLEGCEPFGRGEAWFAHRFRRPSTIDTMTSHRGAP